MATRCRGAVTESNCPERILTIDGNRPHVDRSGNWPKMIRCMFKGNGFAQQRQDQEIDFALATEHAPAGEPEKLVIQYNQDSNYHSGLVQPVKKSQA